MFPATKEEQAVLRWMETFYVSMLSFTRPVTQEETPLICAAVDWLENLREHRDHGADFDESAFRAWLAVPAHATIYEELRSLDEALEALPAHVWSGGRSAS